tara:strand:+ start:174 stop:809 length:636 start_codon:yes stop_codon:yes gene_type:complete
MLSIKLLESDNDIITKINKSIARRFNVLIKRRAKIVQNDIKRLIPSWISEQPEVISLNSDGTDGSLNAQFGLRPGQSAIVIADIINAISESIFVHITPVSPVNLSGGISFSIQPTDFKNLISLSSGIVATEKLQQLHWLDWLLTEGDRVIIAGYEYVPSDGGRSGGGTMKLGRSFRVEPSFSGTVDDNFVTRAFAGRDKQLANLLSKLLKA